MNTIPKIFLIIYCVTYATFAITQFLAAVAIGTMNDALVVGEVPKSKENAATIYTGIIVPLKAFLLAVFGKVLADANDTESLLFAFIFGALSTAIVDLPASALDYLVVECRNWYMLDVQIAAAITHCINLAAFTILLIVAAIFAIKHSIKLNGVKEAFNLTTSSWKEVWCVIFFILTLAAVAGSSYFRVKQLIEMRRMKDYDAKLSSVSLIYMDKSKLPDTQLLKNYELGKELQFFRTNVSQYSIVDSITEITSSSHRSQRTEGSGTENKVTIDEYRHISTINCSSLPLQLRPMDCVNNSYILRFVFRYDVTRGSFSPYGDLHYKCAVLSGPSNTDTCTEGCSDSWGLHAVIINNQTDSSGNDLSTISSPWTEVQRCGPSPIMYEKSLKACSNGYRFEFSQAILLMHVFCMHVMFH